MVSLVGDFPRLKINGQHSVFPLWYHWHETSFHIRELWLLFDLKKDEKMHYKEVPTETSEGFWSGAQWSYNYTQSGDSGLICYNIKSIYSFLLKNHEYILIWTEWFSYTLSLSVDLTGSSLSLIWSFFTKYIQYGKNYLAISTLSPTLLTFSLMHTHIQINYLNKNKLKMVS